MLEQSEFGSSLEAEKSGGVEISVVIACYTDERFDSIKDALESIRKQSLAPRHVIAAVDNNPQLAARLRAEFDWVTVVLNVAGRGSSATRNRGVEVVTTPITAFLDDDETAHEDWLLELSMPFVQPDVVGTGGQYKAVWSVSKPVWFPDEFAWVVGGSYLGMPTETTEVRNVWSGNMAVRTGPFRAVGGFRAGFGKHNSVSHPDDTDLCIRLTKADAGRWMYVPSAVINHNVPVGRTSLRFFVSRCFAEGGGKALMRTRLGSTSTLALERTYVRDSARAAALRLARKEPASILQGAAMLLGLASAAAGYANQQLRSAFSRRARR